MIVPSSFKLVASKNLNTNASLILELHELGIKSEDYDFAIDFINEISNKDIYGFKVFDKTICVFLSNAEDHYHSADLKELYISDFVTKDSPQVEDRSSVIFAKVNLLTNALMNVSPLRISKDDEDSIDNLIKKFESKSSRKSRKKITGRFDTRDELVNFIFSKYHKTSLKQSEIARITEISETSVANILNGPERTKWYSENSINWTED